MSLITDIVRFAVENPVCFIATMDKTHPRVRGILLWLADETGLYFYTHAAKDLHRQLTVNQRVELCFYEPGPTFTDTRMMRIAARVACQKDEVIRERLFSALSYLRKIPAEWNRIIIYRIRQGRVTFWSGADITTRSRSRSFAFPARALQKKGTDASPASGSCLVLKSDQQYHHINHRDIVYLSSSGKSAVVHTRESDYEVRELLKSIEQRLPHTFIRIHRQYVVNRRFIGHIRHEISGRYSLHLTDDDDTVLPVGKRYAPALRIAAGAGVFIP